MGEVQLINGVPTYIGDTFKIEMVRYSDPERLNAARNAAIYLGKKDIDNVRRPLSIIEKGHVAEIFRGEMAEFIFTDVSKEVYDHLVTYTTRNLRVAGGNRALRSNSFAVPSDRMKDPDLVELLIDRSMDSYYRLLDLGETPQVARAAMPIGAKLNTFAFQFNFLTLGQSLFKQRIWEKGAQGNTVKVVKGMSELVRFVDTDLWDVMYDWWGEPTLNWTEVRRKLKKRKINTRDFISKLLVHTEDLDIPAEEAIVKILGEQKSMW